MNAFGRIESNEAEDEVRSPESVRLDVGDWLCTPASTPLRQNRGKIRI